jgi:hypothetical protein
MNDADPPTPMFALRERPPREFGKGHNLRIDDPAPTFRYERIKDVIGLTPEAALEVLREAGCSTLSYADEGECIVWTADYVQGRVRAVTRKGIIVRIM